MRYLNLFALFGFLIICGCTIDDDLKSLNVITEDAKTIRIRKIDKGSSLWEYIVKKDDNSVWLYKMEFNEIVGKAMIFEPTK